MFKRANELTDADRAVVGWMSGKMIQMILEKRSVDYMSACLGLEPREVEYNIDETLYTLRNQVGRWRFFKILFWR